VRRCCACGCCGSSEQEHWLLLTLHHIITDGWSSGVLSRELSELYAAHVAGEASGLPALPVQYADYAVWQREWLQGEVLEQQLAYWKPALAGLPALELPTDRPRRRIASFRGERIIVELDEALTRRIKELGRDRARDAVHDAARGVPGAAVPLQRAGGHRGRRADRRRVRPSSGPDRLLRQHAGAARRLVGRSELRAYLARVRSRALEAYAHQDLPFEKLVEELHPKRDLSRNPLFQVALAMQNTPQAELQARGRRCASRDRLSNESAKVRSPILDHRSRRDAAHARRVRDRSVRRRHDRADDRPLARAAGGIVADPRRADLASCRCSRRTSAADARGVERDERRVPRERRIHELFEQQAARTPDAMAVTHGEQHLTMAELNARRISSRTPAKRWGWVATSRSACVSSARPSSS
jgi:hypothetical protein